PGSMAATVSATAAMRRRGAPRSGKTRSTRWCGSPPPPPRPPRPRAPGLTLVTLGPLTNIALALARDPGFAANVGRCVVMAGAPCCEGNVTPAAEYNIWCDPEAACVVARSGLPVELIGWHLCRGEAALSRADL